MGDGKESSKTLRGLIFQQKEHPCFDASRLQLSLKLSLFPSLSASFPLVMFAWWISYEEKTATEEITLMSRDSGFHAVNCVAPNRTIRDKEKNFQLLLHMNLFIYYACSEETKLKKRMENGSTVMMTETNRSWVLFGEGKIFSRGFYELVKHQRDSTLLLSHDFPSGRQM